MRGDCCSKTTPHTQPFEDDGTRTHWVDIKTYTNQGNNNMTLYDDLAEARAEFKRNELRAAQTFFAPPLNVEKLAHAYNNVMVARGFADGIPLNMWSEIVAEYNQLMLEQLSSDQNDPERGDSSP